MFLLILYSYIPETAILSSSFDRADSLPTTQANTFHRKYFMENTVYTWKVIFLSPDVFYDHDPSMHLPLTLHLYITSCPPFRRLWMAL